jgi:hypothetical protein
MKRMLVLLGLIGMAFGTTAFAAQDGAGCGLGSMLFKGQSGMIPNLLAMTTNGMFGNTFAMTSGTSGCKADSVVMKDKEQEAFVATTLSALNQEMAQGQGQHLTALASLLGCPAAVHGDFARMSQESYGTVFAQSDVQAGVVLASLKDEMGRRPTLASSCTRIS